MQFRPKATARAPEFNVVGTTGGKACDVDPARFQQAVGNVLANAVRHSPAGGAVDVAAADLGDAGIVSDTGIGMSGFLRGLPATFASMDVAARTGELKTLASLLHTLKGTAGSYGFAELTRIAEEGEARLGSGAPAELLAVCRKLRAAFAARILHGPVARRR